MALLTHRRPKEEMTDKMFDEWWADAKLNTLESRKPDVWEEVQECMDDIKDFVMDQLQETTPTKDITDFAGDIGLSGMWKTRFVKACEALKQSRAAPSALETSMGESGPYSVQTDLAEGSINRDTSSVDDEEAEGLVKETQNIPVDEEKNVDHDQVNTKVSFGVQVDAQSKWLNNESKEESVMLAYPDLKVNGQTTVKQLQDKMKEYLYAPEIESYVIYTNPSRTTKASDNVKIADIAKKDEETQMYTVYAKKEFKSFGASQSEVNELAEKMVVSATVLEGLVAALDHVDEEINCYVSDLQEIFGRYEDDPVLRTLLAVCRFKGQLQQNRKDEMQRKIDMAKQNYDESDGKSALSQVMMYGGMAGTCLGMVGGVCSLYSWKQDRKIEKWKTMKADDKKAYKAWKKKNGSDPKKRAAYRAKKAANNRKIAKAKSKAKWAGRANAGIQGLGMAMQAAQLGMQIYQMIDEANQRAEALQKHRDELVKQNNECANSFESSALIYDNLVTVLWNLRTMLRMAFRKELDEEKVFAEFDDDEKDKPTFAKYKSQIQSKDTAGKPEKLFALKNAVQKATRTVINYLRDLSEKYSELKTYLESQKDFKAEGRKKSLADIDKKIQNAPNAAVKEYLLGEKKALLAEDGGQTLKEVFESFLTHQQKHDVAFPERGTHSDRLEMYYNAFLVYSFQTVGSTEGSPYGKYNINPRIDMDTAVLEILDKDNLLKNDLLFCDFFDPKEFDIDQYIADDLMHLSTPMKTLAFVRVARARYMIFSSYKSHKAEQAANSQAKKEKKLGRNTARSDAFEKYSFTFMLFLMKVYKINPVENIKYTQK